MRATQLSPHQVRLLRDWGDRLYEMFGETPYLVGSSLKHSNWRDVDVRVIVPDKTFRRITKSMDLLRLNLCLTVWGERATGLPIDCQVQSQQEACRENGRRHPIRNVPPQGESND